MDHYSLWINGEAWDTSEHLTVTDKASGTPWATVSQAGPREVEAAVAAASQAFAAEATDSHATLRYFDKGGWPDPLTH